MKLFDSIIIAKLILDTAKSLGAQIDDLEPRITMLDGNQNDLIKTVPYDLIKDLLCESIQRTQSDNFWLDMTKNLDMKAMFGVLAYSTCTAASLKDAINFGYDVLHKTSNVLSIKVTCNNDECTFTIYPFSTDEETSTFIDFHMANFTKLNRLEIDKNFRPIRLELQHATPNDIDTYNKWFNCPVLFNQKNNALIFSADIINAPLNNSDPVLNSVLKPYSDSILKLTKENHTVADQVSIAITHLLPLKKHTIDNVSRLVGIPTRSLQNELQKEEKSFQHILDNTRMEYALNMLKASNVKLSSVAEELGFSDVSSFSRAFKRWTGKSPSQY
ncbi:MAG: AraC family transcriptional regulator [Gammaproteobacteria bacterium]|nr:AraC family transcriptional regulator [Gammaproteobacteria bacterium]